MPGAAWRQGTQHAEEQAQAVLAAIAEAVTAVGAVPGSDGAVAELVRAGILAAELRDALRAAAAEDFCREVLFDAGAEHGRAQALAAVPGPPGRRAASRAQKNPILNVVKGGLASAAAVLGLKALTKGAAAHHVVLAAATAVTVPAVIAGAVYVSSQPGTASPAPAATAAPAAGAGDSAVPVTWPSPGVPAVHGRAPKAAADGTGSQDQAQDPPPASAAATSPAATPQPAGQQSATSLSAAPPPAPGVLSADVTAADFGAQSTATVTLTASGGPVTWGLVCSDAADVSLSQPYGTLPDGGSVTVTLTLSPAMAVAGTAMLTVYPGDLRIPVTWEPAAATPAPADTTQPSPPAPSPAGSLPLPAGGFSRAREAVMREGA